MTSYFAARYDEAVDELSRTIQLDDRFGMARAFLGATYVELGRYLRHAPRSRPRSASAAARRSFSRASAISSGARAISRARAGFSTSCAAFR